MTTEATLAKMNADLNTTAAWERRWQIEREHNERLMKTARQTRAAALDLRARYVQRCGACDCAAKAAATDDPARAAIEYRNFLRHMGAMVAMDDFLAALDRIDTAE